jgi:hypothetical protein
VSIQQTGVPSVGTSVKLFLAMAGKSVIKISSFASVVLLLALGSLAQSTGPATQPSSGPGAPIKSLSGDQALDQMLKPPADPSRQLAPAPDRQATDKTSGNGAIKPDAPKVVLKREGEYIWNREARITHTPSGQTELTFESDGKALRDPPMLVLPNQLLQQMEDQITSASKDLKYRVSGMITEFRGRNYILLVRAVVIPDITQQF